MTILKLKFSVCQNVKRKGDHVLLWVAHVLVTAEISTSVDHLVEDL